MEPVKLKKIGIYIDFLLLVLVVFAIINSLTEEKSNFLITGLLGIVFLVTDIFNRKSKNKIIGIISKISCLLVIISFFFIK